MPADESSSLAAKLAPHRRRAHGPEVGRAARLVSASSLLAMGMLLGLGCGGGQTRGHPLDSSWDDEDGSELAHFQANWSKVKTPTLAHVVVGVVDHQTLIGRTTEAASTWRYHHEIDSRPQIAGSVVLGIGGGELFALDAHSGRQLWTRPALGKLRGAADDGKTTLVSVASLSGRRSIVLAIARDGSVLRQIDEVAEVGRPTIFNEFAFLPYDGKSVLIMDLVTGREAARVISSVPVSHAFIVDQELYFGEQTVMRFDERIVLARKGKATQLRLPARRFAADPRWRLPGALPLPPEATRHDSIRFYARPRSSALGLAIDGYYLSYFQLAIGLDPKGRTRWVHSGPAAHIGGAEPRDAVALCDTAGDVRWLDSRTGALRFRLALGEAVVGCTVQSDDTPGPRLESEPPPPLTQQLGRAIALKKRHLVGLQLQLLDELAGLDDAARELLELASEEVGSKIVRARAKELLRKPQQSVDVLLQALDKGKTPKGRPIPLAAVATSLSASLTQQAAPMLAQQLNNLLLPPDVTTDVARALQNLATKQQRAALAVFFARAGCREPTLQDAAVAVARTLIRIGDLAMVRAITSKACENNPLGPKLRAAIDGYR